MKLYVFNPESDLALAHNNENYLAPASIRQMAQDLALLPIWYALPGSAVLAPSAYNADYLKEMQRLFSLFVQLVTEPELPECSDVRVAPWGWNMALRKRLLRGGVSEQNLLPLRYMEAYRLLSSRKIAMLIVNLFNYEKQEWLCGVSDGLYSLSDCQRFVEEHDACVLKAPWSGSGKGLNWCKGTFTKSIEGWCKRIIEEQEVVFGEPFYNKVEDFAMEFYFTGQEVLFVGYSLFTTNDSGAYSGNMLMSTGDIEKRITQHVPLYVLISVRERLRVLLMRSYGRAYSGYLGVDMMVCLLPGGRYALHPCVEINMRMNMGVVSYMFHEHFMVPEATGSFVVEHSASNDELQAKHQQDMTAYPLVVEQGKLVSGYLPLVPVTKKSLYRAFVKV